jgi:neutral ceramidase
MGLGCPLEVPAYDFPAAQRKDRFSIGVGVQDITPPPGFPTGGHGPAGALAKGYWVRLRARAFFFEDRQGRTLALVSADLFAIPGGLKARVAQLVAARLTDEKFDVAFAPESLILAATHTHQGPGNFMTARIYNQFGSSYSGFSCELFEFLANRIATAIVNAVSDARRRTGSVSLVIHRSKVPYTLLHNRSPRVFMLNSDSESILRDLNKNDGTAACQPLDGESDTDWKISDCPRLRAADRVLTVVDLIERAADGSDITFGSVVFFSVHPTVLATATPLYSPDIFGYAAEQLARRWATAKTTPLVAFFNGAEGDISTRRTTRDFIDAVVLGEALAKEVERVRGANHLVITLDEQKIGVRSRVVHTSNESERRCENWSLAAAPTVGAPALGGAEGDRTALHALGWTDGVLGKPVGGQGDKLPALDSALVRAVRLTSEFAPADSFPEALPITLHEIGELQLLAVPFELTTSQGYALRRALEGLFGRHSRAQRIEIIGLANEYASYVATLDEYAAQDYVGASTIWGPEQGPFLACSLRGLQPVTTASGHVRAREFHPGSKRIVPFGLDFIGDELHSADEGLGNVLLDLHGLPERHLPWFIWTERIPRGMSQTTRRVTIWQKTSTGWKETLTDGTREDDLGTHFVTVSMDGKKRWAAIWLWPLLEPATQMSERSPKQLPVPTLQGTFRFVVFQKNSEPICSEPFEITPGKRPSKSPRSVACKSDVKTYCTFDTSSDYSAPSICGSQPWEFRTGMVPLCEQ